MRLHRHATFILLIALSALQASCVLWTTETWWETAERDGWSKHRALRNRTCDGSEVSLGAERITSRDRIAWSFLGIPVIPILDGQRTSEFKIPIYGLPPGGCDSGDFRAARRDGSPLALRVINRDYRSPNYPSCWLQVEEGRQVEDAIQIQVLFPICGWTQATYKRRSGLRFHLVPLQ